MPMPPNLTQDQRESITAALFRREDNATVAAAHGVSERQIRRMIQNLKQYGTVIAPRLKKMGRPSVLTKEIEEDLKEYVSHHPLALLEDMQKHIQTTHNVKCSRASLSRRMADMGFSRGIIRRGFRSTETSLPHLSQHDFERIAANQAENELRDQQELGEAGGAVDPSLNGQQIGGAGELGEQQLTPGGGTTGNNKKTKYAWLTEGEPVRKPKRKKSEIQAATASQAQAQAEAGQQDHQLTNEPLPPNEPEVVVQPGLDSMVLNGHLDSTGQEEMDLQRLGHEAQDRIAQSQYPLPVAQQSLPPLPPAHDGYGNPHSSPFAMYPRPDDAQHQLPPPGPVHNTYPKRVSFGDQFHHQGP